MWKFKINLSSIDARVGETDRFSKFHICVCVFVAKHPYRYCDIEDVAREEQRHRKRNDSIKARQRRKFHTLAKFIANRVREREKSKTMDLQKVIDT